MAPPGVRCEHRTRDRPVIVPFAEAHLDGAAPREPELVRDLYAAAASVWVEQGLMRHFVIAPPSAELLDPWFRLSFGVSAALAIRETAGAHLTQGPAHVGIRPGTPDDLPDVARHAAALVTP